MTWKKNGDQKYDFEVLAANVDGYVALGISPSPSMVSTAAGNLVIIFSSM